MTDYPVKLTRCGSALHVEEERGGAAPRRHQALALLRHFARFLAVLAPHREGQRPEAALRDFLAALEAISVGRLFQAPQRFLDFVERFSLHLDEGEFDLFLDV